MNPHLDNDPPMGPALPARDLPFILDALPVALSWSSLADGRILFMNRAFTQLFGYALEQFPTVTDWIDGCLPREQDRKAAHRVWKQVWQLPGTGTVDIGPWETQAKRADGGLFTVRYRGILLHTVGVGIVAFEDISESTLATQALSRQADEDPLTRLPNRRALQKRWAADIQDQREQASAAVLMANLNGFKQVNETWGHDVGDEVLIVVARRLKHCLREDDVICRLGADEFVVLLPTLADPARAALVCRRLCEVVRQPIDIEGERIALDIRIGVALYPQDGNSLQAVLRRASQAASRIKHKGDGGWAWHHPPGMQRREDD